VSPSRGFYVWHRQLVGKRRFEVADAALSAFYRAEAAIAHARDPATVQGEGATRKRHDNELPAFRGLLDKLYVPLERIKHYRDAFDELERAAVNVEVHFGSDLADALREPLRAYEKIAIATACRMGRVGLSAQVKLSPALVRRWEAVVRSGEYCDVRAEDADQICAEMSEAKRTIETALRSYLEAPTFSEFLALRRLRVLVTGHIGRLFRRRHQSSYGKIAVYAQLPRA
jgi:hypothetical protein